jgi:hypothetical protein
MKVNKPGNPMVKRMLESEIRKNYRWYECEKRQCFTVKCQAHLHDNSWKKQ